MSSSPQFLWVRIEASRARHRLVALALAASFGLVLTGCAAFSSSNSFSESSGSVSDSVGSSSDSSGSSGSSSGDEEQAYRREVRDYVALAAARETAPATVRRGVSEIALGFGVSDWEASPATREAIEAGLAGVAAADRYRIALATGPADTPSAGEADAVGFSAAN